MKNTLVPIGQIISEFDTDVCNVCSIANMTNVYKSRVRLIGRIRFQAPWSEQSFF